ncbi:MAG: tetratricopeptide repeat protein [Myxococcales bacterium]|nr:tetratricopeptide repeat protein [Myxococcales bacterium]MCB9605425.1 tetratricopeptide repeat protein [Polyangiaceae bacterium]
MKARGAKQSVRRASAPTSLLRAGGAVAVAAWAILSGCSPYGSGVTRIVDGRTQEGRYIPVTAYADYALASYLEASGEPEQAENAYMRALADDPRSPEMWTRLAALRCRRQPMSGMSALERAFALATEYEPAWREKAACHLGARQLDQAQAAAERAVALDPEQERATLLLAQIYEARGEKQRARTWLNAWVVLHPSSDIGWTAFLELAEREGNVVDQLRAHRALRLHQDPMRTPVLTAPPSGKAPEDALDVAIGRDDLDAARRACLALHLPAVEVAIRSYLRGNKKLARAQAELVLGADPSNSDARALLLLLGDQAASSELWASPDALSPRVRQLLDAELARIAE